MIAIAISAMTYPTMNVGPGIPQVSSMASLCRRCLAPSHRFFHDVEHPAQFARRTAGGQVQHQAVVGELEELGEDLDGYVVAQHPGLALTLQTVAGGVGDGRGTLGPALGERR